MKNQDNKVWASAEELTNDPSLSKLANEEFVALPIIEQAAEQIEEASSASSRRDFLKWAGFSVSAAAIAASCEIPVKKAIPYVSKPDEIVPGVANYYASTYAEGGDYCAILVKTREGRPIKIEGNTLSKITKGGTSARAQASVLSLYDTNRIQKPGTIADGKVMASTWEAIDREIASKLTASSKIRIVTNTNISPSRLEVVRNFQAKYPNTAVVTYDAVSASGMLDANEASMGIAALPSYHFDKADVIVSLGADFLGTWLSPTEFATQYAENRKIKDTKNASMSRHIQVESHMSMTGSNADNRILIKPSEMGAAIATLYNELGGSVSAPKVNAKAAAALKKAAAELKAARGRSLVVSGSNNVGEQILVNAINDMLGNYGKTLSFDRPSYARTGRDAQIQGLIAEMNTGGVDAVFVMDGANPAFDLPNADKFVTGMAKVGTKVYFGQTMNETGETCNYATPTHNFLEAWGDAEPKMGMLSLQQPTINPLFDTRQTEETLLRWGGNNQPFADFLKDHWASHYFSNQSQFATFQSFWDSSLHDGVFEMNGAAVTPTFSGDVASAAAKINKPEDAGIEISFYETVNVGAGQHLGNPWLTEMPDPVARTVWGNYLAVPVSWDGSNTVQAMNGLNPNELYGSADIVDLTVNGVTEQVTCVRQFGQPQNTVALALGYGRKTIGDAGKNVGNNVFPMLSLDANGNTKYYATKATVSNSIEVDERFASVQYHHTMGVKAEDPNTGKIINVGEKTSMNLGSGYQGGIVDRTVIFQDNFKNIDKLTEKIHKAQETADHRNSKTLYPFDEYTKEFYSQGHHWGMWVDLNGCIGCGACQVACVAENNVPMVGKMEVARHHEMTWLRIDRYYYGDFENPNVVYQPMMCQHCDNAPCENVCPVAATNHSSEGLNQMTYNRCIGTRYCANNCPYKVRRFNWLDYTTADLFPANQVTLNGEDGVPYGADNLTRMVLNPDVTVRSRGVIEKCSFCVQRIQEGKLTAKSEHRALRDGEVKTACQTACPTGAIVFGDMNNKKSALVQNVNGNLNYRVLDEINTQSSVYYSAKVINRDESMDA